MTVEPIRIELHRVSQRWIARLEGMEDYESNPMPTPHEALMEAAQLLEQFWEAFRVLKEEKEE